MADHMRRNDKLQALANDASRAQARSASRRASDAQDSGASSYAGRRARDARDGAEAGQRAGSAGRRPSHGSGASPMPGQQPPRRRGQQAARGGEAQQGKRMTLVEFVKANSAFILSVVAVVAIVLVMIGFIRACSPVEEVEQANQSEEAYVSPYDWTKLDRTDGRFAYVVDGKVESRLGIDVSESQLEIDWNAVASDGIDFAMIRLGYRGATEGDLYYDAQFNANLSGAKNAGIDCGIYFFSQAINESEAIEEADFVIEALNGASLEYPIAFDSEVVASLGAVRTEGLSNDEMTAIALAFCNRVEEAGYRSYIYGNVHDLARYNKPILDSHEVWLAEFGSSVPNAQLDMVMWQYANDGAVNGIQTQVDMNIDLTGALS